MFLLRVVSQTAIHFAKDYVKQDEDSSSRCRKKPLNVYFDHNMKERNIKDY